MSFRQLVEAIAEVARDMPASAFRRGFVRVLTPILQRHGYVVGKPSGWAWGTWWHPNSGKVLDLQHHRFGPEVALRLYAGVYYRELGHRAPTEILGDTGFLPRTQETLDQAITLLQGMEDRL